MGYLTAPFLDHYFFHIYICYIFYDTDHLDIANYAHENTPHAYSLNLSTILEKFEKGTEHIFNWILNSHLKCQNLSIA